MAFGTASAETIPSPLTPYGIDDSAIVGIYVKDLVNDTIVDCHQETLSMTPASITKSLTVATAMRVVGPGYRFVTKTSLVGSRQGNRFNGRLVVTAGGDPSIGSRYIESGGAFVDSIVARMSRLGISSFVGEVEVDDNGYDQQGPSMRWEIADVPWSYGAAFSAFNFGDNVASLNLKTMKAEPEVPCLTIVRGRKSGAFSLERGLNSQRLIVKGKTAGRDAVTVTVPCPAQLFESSLSRALAAEGIVWHKQRAKTNRADTLDSYVHYSSPLSVIAKSLMTRSDNMMADAVLRSVAPSHKLDDALSVERRLWDSLGVDINPIRLVDGSGLIRTDSFTPRALGRVLEAMSADTAYVAAFPVVGREGTVASFLKETPLAGRLAMKSGSMTAVRCYAGYKLGGDGRPTHAVVLMINNSYLPGTELRHVLERYLCGLFGRE
jgi:D-alanyl-D-alanine carboxypeptidase/D-alanyl-D-alanine-endopeptidase (penicillin-binding protein 4)